MERSLTALVPVRNVEATLEATLLEMLEVLPDLTSQLELVVVDDCSCDATIEAADELVGRFPQLLVLRHAVPKGRAAAIQTGLRHSRAEVVFLADEDCELALGEVRKLWDALDEHELVLGRPARIRASCRQSGKTRRSILPGGFQMGYRRALLGLASAMVHQEVLIANLRQRGLRWHEVQISPRIAPVGPHRIAAMARNLNLWTPPGRKTDWPLSIERPVTSRPKRPNYLNRLKQFALGE